jgi:hypothetical protein
MLRALWRNRWALLRAGVLLIVVGAVGTGLYVAVPPEPRWVLADGPRGVFNAGDGRIATYRLAASKALGPVQLLDVATGTELSRFLEGDETFKAYSHTEDGRFFVALARGHQPGACQIRGVDLHEQREWQVDIPVGPYYFGNAAFAPNAAFVALRLLRPDATDEHIAIIDCHTGRIAARVENPALNVRIEFSSDGGCLVASYHDEDEVGHVDVTDTRAGKTTAINGAAFIAVSPDARWLIADRGEEGVWLWDIAGARWHGPVGDPQAQRRPPRAGDMERRARLYELAVVQAYAARARTARIHHGRAVRLWGNIRHARAFLAMHTAGGGQGFSPDARLVYSRTTREAAQTDLEVHDVRTGRLLWKRSWGQEVGEPIFPRDSQHLVLADAQPVEVIDAATGATAWTVSPAGAADVPLELARDGRTLMATVTPPEKETHWLWAKIEEWLAPEPDADPIIVRAFDLETGAVVAEACVDTPDTHWLTEDRRSLVTVYSKSDDNGTVATTIRCWDTPPHKPFRWILSVPLALGATLLAFAFGWRRLRRRPVLAARQTTTMPGS